MDDRPREVGVVAKLPKRPRWAEAKARLETFDRKGLVSLIHDLYEASPANRRFLDSRLLSPSAAIEEYRRLVADAICPDPLSRRRISVRDTCAVITAYRRATGNLTGTVDLMLTFVEAGTEQAADLGYGDDDYFDALANKLKAIEKAFDELPATVRATAVARLTRVRARGMNIGWGYGDLLDDEVRKLERRAEPTPPTTSRSRRALS